MKPSVNHIVSVDGYARFVDTGEEKNCYIDDGGKLWT